MKVAELAGFPKLKGKYTTFYKAFPFLPDGEEMQVKTNCDIFALTEEDAIRYYLENVNMASLSNDVKKYMESKWKDDFGLLKEVLFEEAKMKKKKDGSDEFKLVEFKKLVVPFYSVDILNDDLREKEALTGDEEIYWKDGIVSLSLNNKTIKNNVGTKRLVSFKIRAKDGVKEISTVVLHET